MKISRRNFLKVLGSATMAGALAACGGSSSTSAAVSGAASTAAAPGTTYTMNIGSVMSASHPSIVALQSFEKAVEERTNGGIQVEIYTDSALGGESDLIEQVRGGSTEACMQMGAANFEGINAEVNVALLPFLFTSLDNARPVHLGERLPSHDQQHPPAGKARGSEGNQVPHQREQHEGRHVRRTGRFHRHHGLL